MDLFFLWWRNRTEICCIVQKWLKQTFFFLFLTNKNNIFSLSVSLFVRQRWLPTCAGVDRGSRWCWRETGWCWPAWLEAAGLCSTAGLSTTATSLTGHHSTGQLAPTGSDWLFFFFFFCHGSLCYLKVHVCLASFLLLWHGKTAAAHEPCPLVMECV